MQTVHELKQHFISCVITSSDSWFLRHLRSSLSRDTAKDNFIDVNMLKTKELIFCKPRISTRLLPPPIFGIEQVSSFKLLGVTLSQRLSMDQHVNNILSIIMQRFYLLNQLKNKDYQHQLLTAFSTP